ASTGVAAFVTLELVNGRSQRSAPVAALTPTSLVWVSVMICRVPSNSATIGDPYDGPSPAQLQITLPVRTSNAVRAPWLLPPTWNTTAMPSTTGENACVVKIGTMGDPGVGA